MNWLKYYPVSTIKISCHNRFSYYQLLKQMDSKTEDSIQVCIRIKPGNQEDSIVQYTLSQVHLDKNHFGFDKIFPPQASQEQIFQTVGTKVISHTLDGYNGCIFVYGQTGSGKTYTMMGEGNGLMQKSFVRLFQDIQKLQKAECVINCSYYEIYNEQIIDLLDSRKDKKLNIRQDLKKGIFIENITEETIYSQVKLQECLNIGMRNRHVGETMMNRQSSRSHSIFTISFSIKMQINGSQVLKTPKLHFVDLAGSERQKMTAASGQRLKQAGSINKSLTTLGMVINALASEKTRTHIPYRDSKLTSLLRDSLGGNSKTFLIATISRNLLCFQETLSTLNFANRAKMVKVKAQVNEQSLSTNIEIYKQQIRKLKAEIIRLKSQKKAPTPNPGEVRWMSKSGEQNGNYDEQFNEINKKISVISDHLAKNPLSPSVQQLLQQIKRLKPQVFNGVQNNQQMIDEAQLKSVDNDQEEEEDPLIQYLSCNNTLLQKIHTKIDQYVELKQQLRSLAYNNQLTIASLKTPSKFQRQQYEQLLEKRDNQICELHSQLRQLRSLVADQQVRYMEAVTQSQRMEKHKNSMSEQNTQKYQKQRVELQRELTTLRNLLKQTNQESTQVNKRYQELQTQYRETKQLYIYAEQNYEGEKLLRDQIEKNLLQKMMEIENIKNQYTEKLQQQKEYFEEVEEGLRQQLNVLAQTAQFNEALITEYKTKLQKEKSGREDIEGVVKKLQLNIQQILKQMQFVNQKLLISQQSLQNCTIELARVQRQYSCMLEEKDSFIKKINEEKRLVEMSSVESQIKYETAITEYMQQLSKLDQQLKDTLNMKQKTQAELNQKLENNNNYYENKIRNLEQTHGSQVQNMELQMRQVGEKCTILSNELMTKGQKLGQAQQLLIEAEREYKKLQEETCMKIQQIYQQTKTKLENTRVLEIENEELKKQYKILQKQNYKIKSKYVDNSNSNKTQEELSAKVNYYEQKFKLMSIQYQKAMQVVKKLKEKQLNQAQKISNLEQSHKLMKMSYQSEQHNIQNSSLLKNLSQQNNELKQQLQLIKSQASKQQSAHSYMNKMSIEQEKTMLKQKEQYFKKKIQQSINRWDPSKENVVKNRSLEELIQSWEEIEGESCKKFDAIAKGIKREQKLKTQNNLIVKQNIYLKEQINQLQKQAEQKLSNPRKKVKLDLVQIQEESMQ